MTTYKETSTLYFRREHAVRILHWTTGPVMQVTFVSKTEKGKTIFFPHQDREIQYQKRWMLYKTLVMSI